MTTPNQVLLGGVIPINHLRDLQPYFDYAFVEPVEDSDYVNFYKDFRGLKILDNTHGVYGVRPTNVDTLIIYSLDISADLVIAPDILGNWDFNQRNAEEFGDFWPREKTFVCLAGPNPIDFVYQKEWLLKEGFGGVCLPYRINRIAIHPEGMRCHLLGLRVPEQFGPYLSKMPTLTLDTAEPISAALLGIRYEDLGGLWTVKRPKDYINQILSPTQLEIAVDNIRFLKQWIRERSQPTPT